MASRSFAKIAIILVAMLISVALIGAAYAVYCESATPVTVQITAVSAWDGVLTVDTSGVQSNGTPWFETDDCRAFIVVTYSDETTNAEYPGAAMTRTSANLYTYQTNLAKTIASVQIVRLNNAGTYMYNKTSAIAAANIPSNHTIALTGSDFSTITISNRTPYYALTFNITWATFSEGNAVPRVCIMYDDGTEYTPPASALVKTETDSNRYTVNWDAVRDPNKTVKNFKLLRCDPANNDIIWNESTDRTMTQTHVTAVNSMNAWSGALTVSTSAISWFETDNCRAHIFVTYSDSTTNAAYPGEAMTRSKANTYTYTTNVAKAVSSIVILRMNNAGTYMYNATASLANAFSHKITLAAEDFTEIPSASRTPYYALTFNITWGSYVESGSVLRLKINYTDESSVTVAAGSFVKTETSTNTYTVDWDSVRDGNKTVSSFKLLRCSSSNNDTVLHESASFVSGDIGASRVINVATMTEPSAPAPDTFETIYYYNENSWSSVKAYAWSGTGNAAVDYLNAFPGTLMTAVGGHDGWYSISVIPKPKKSFSRTARIKTTRPAI